MLRRTMLGMMLEEKIEPNRFGSIVQQGVQTDPTCCVQQCWRMLDQHELDMLNETLGFGHDLRYGDSSKYY